MHLTYELTASEYIAAQNLHYRRTPLGFIFMVILYVAAPMLGLFLVLGVASIIRQTGVSISSISQLLYPLFLALTPLWFHLYMRSRFKARQVSNAPYVVDIEEDRLVEEIPGSLKCIVAWAAVKRFRESKKVLVIYVSRISFIVIPRRVLGKEEYSHLIALLRQKLSSRVA